MVNKISSIHCCDNMHYYVKEGNNFMYDPSIRSYDVKIDNNQYGDMQTLYYCPWCGTKLPESIGEVRAKILKEEYGIEDPYWDDAEKVPEEFKTDEWWKKRGL